MRVNHAGSLFQVDQEFPVPLGAQERRLNCSQNVEAKTFRQATDGCNNFLVLSFIADHTTLSNLSPTNLELGFDECNNFTPFFDEAEGRWQYLVQRDK
jgi:hypothetical protein